MDNNWGEMQTKMSNYMDVWLPSWGPCGIEQLHETRCHLLHTTKSFLETMKCKDCPKLVMDMLDGAPKKGLVVFYCDEGIKGFDAPAQDPMKAELTCDLVLCPRCEAGRRVEFEKEIGGIGCRGRNRSKKPIAT